MNLIRVDELRIIPPVLDGLVKFKEEIKKGSRVFCICSIGRDFHVGAKDAEETLTRAVDRKQLIVQEAERTEDQLYVPKKPTKQLQNRLDWELRRREEELDSLYRTLEEAYPAFDRLKERLDSQGEEVHEKFVKAFLRLRAISVLPPTTGNAAFNHQGMTLLMLQCFWKQDRLIEYLRNPDLLPVAEFLPSANEKRLELLIEKYTSGKPFPAKESQLQELSRAVREQTPRVTEKDYNRLGKMQEKALRIREANEKLQKRLERLTRH